MTTIIAMQADARATPRTAGHPAGLLALAATVTLLLWFALMPGADGSAAGLAAAILPLGIVALVGGLGLRGARPALALVAASLAFAGGVCCAAEGIALPL